MCVNFTACSKDDGSDGAGGTNGGDYTNEKKLTKIVSETWTEKFSYDNQGRLIEVEEILIDGTSKYTYIWGDDAVVVNKNSETELFDTTTNYTYSINNGMVQSVDKGENPTTYHYNSSNRLSRIVSQWYTEEYVWNGDKLMTIEEGAIKFTYKECCTKGYSPLLVEWVEVEPLFIAHPEAIGSRTKQLPATVTESWNDGPGYGEQTEVISYSYKFDNEGYISQIDMAQYGEKITFTLTWE